MQLIELLNAQWRLGRGATIALSDDGRFKEGAHTGRVAPEREPLAGNTPGRARLVGVGGRVFRQSLAE